MGEAEVFQAMRNFAARLDEMGIPYALVGAMALNEHGYKRVTTDVDVLMTRESLAKFKEVWLGRGYLERFPGSRGLRDTELGVKIDVIVTGDYPGDGQPKAVRFPDPAQVAIREDGLSLIPLVNLVEMKLASGMSNLGRAKDIGDVVELIKHAKVPRELGDQLDPSVRDRYFELWEAAQIYDPISDG